MANRSDQALAALVRALRLLNEELPFLEALEALLDMAIDVSGAARGFIVLQEGDELRPVVARNYSRVSLDDEKMHFSRSLIRKVVASNTPLLTDNATDDPRLAANKSIQLLGLSSVICVPLSVHAQVRGVVYLDNRFYEGAFQQEDLDFLSALASQASTVLFSTHVLEQQRRMRDLLGRYVSPEVAEELLAREDLSLVARRQEVSVMFSDIRGFTTMAQSADPIDTLKLLNRYYEQVVEVVFRHRGTLITFLGDAVMVAFGAPLSSPDHAACAIAAAQDLQAVAGRFYASGEPLRVGVGIASGEAVVGDVGSPKRREFAVIGHTTNVAARVEKLTASLECPILYTEATWEQAERQGVFVGEHSLKGMSRPERIYRPFTTEEKREYRLRKQSG